MHLKIEDIYELLNGPSERKELLMKHIQKCENCRESFEMRKDFIQSIRNFQKLSAPSDFSSQILFEIERRKIFLKKLSIFLTSFPIVISSLLIFLISISGFPKEELSSFMNQSISFAVEVFKSMIKIAMGINKLISSFSEIFKKFSTASSSLVIPIFAIFLILTFSAILFLILIDYLSLRSARNENS